jgi:uncharacterized protein with PIN domain
MNAMSDVPKPILGHSVVGPYDGGTYLVVYSCAHTSELTAVCECSSKESAHKEVDRLNQEQLVSEEAIQMERALRGFRRMASGSN